MVNTLIPTDYAAWLASLKEQIRTSRVKASLAVKDLKFEFPDMKGLSPRNMRYMQAFASAWPDEAMLQQLVAQIPWGHNVRILDQVKDRQTREWYIKKTIENGWSRSVLEYQIETQLHTRLGMAQNNFARTLPDPQSELARDVVIELKNSAFKFEYTGQLNGYLAAVDDLVRDKAVDAPTIGLILCKSKKRHHGRIRPARRGNAYGCIDF